MPRRLIDISVPLKAGIKSDPPHTLPQIEYLDHHQTAPAMAEYMGVSVDQFPDGEYAAVERVAISTHNGTHLDAPYHYFSTMNHALKPGGEPSWRIDEVPLEWCFQPGVKLDFRHFADGYVATPGDVEAELKRIGHTLRPLEIVVVNTAAGANYGQDDYVDSGCGMGKAATLWLLERGVRLVGTDGWSWDAPFSLTRKRVAGNRRRRPDLGRPSRRPGNRLFAPGEAAQPGAVAAGRLRRRVLPGEGASRLRRLDPGGRDPARLKRHDVAPPPRPPGPQSGAEPAGTRGGRLCRKVMDAYAPIQEPAAAKPTYTQFSV